MNQLELVWKELEDYNGNGSKSISYLNCRIKFYKGAMEIPLVSFQPAKPLTLTNNKMNLFNEMLSLMGLELDCVEEGNNYKINRIEDHSYIGRITTDALKLHAARSKELGLEVFNKIISYFIQSGEYADDRK